jgi:hypothetical protein
VDHRKRPLDERPNGAVSPAAETAIVTASPRFASPPALAARTPGGAFAAGAGIAFRYLRKESSRISSFPASIRA